MWSFSQEPSPHQRQASLRTADANTLLTARHPRPLQSSHAANAVTTARPLLRAHDKNSDLGPAPAAKENSGSRPGFDFSRIRVHATALPAIQKKLTVNTPGDSYEQEADRVSQFVMQMPGPQLQRSCACGGTCSDCQNKTATAPLQMKAARPGSPAQAEAPPIVHDVLRSPGQPLDAATRSFMEPRFGWDFSRVRIHSDTAAQQSAREVNARAYTVGNDVVFGSGSFAPASVEGRDLMAHELTHTIQQSSSAADHASAPARAGSASTQSVPALNRAPLQISRQPSQGGGAAPGMHPDSMKFLEDKMREFYGLLSGKQRINLKRNSTIAIGMATIDGEPRLVYTVASNKTSPEITAAADKLGLNRWTYDTDVKGRGAVGAPNDAEQLMKEFASDHDFELHGMVVSRRVCPDCAESMRGSKGGPISVSVVEDPIAVPRVQSAPKNPDKAKPPKAKDAEAKQAKPAASTKSDAKKTDPAKTAAAKTEPKKTDPAKPQLTKTEPAKTDAVKIEPAKTAPAKPEPAKVSPPIDSDTAPATSSKAKAPIRDEPTAATRPSLGPEPEATGGSSKKSIPDINLSEYPPDKEGPIVGRFRDGEAISTTVAVVGGAITVVSLATDSDISALGFVRGHFDSEIDDAFAEFRSKYPEVSVLRTTLGLDQSTKAYDDAFSNLQLPQKAVAAVGLLALMTPEKDREAFIATALQNIATAGGGPERLQNYFDAGKSYLNSAFIMESTLQDLRYFDLPGIANDIDRRASALTAASSQLKDTFYSMLQYAVAWWGPGEMAALEILHLSDVFGELAHRLGGLAAQIDSRANDYQKLWGEVEENQKKVFRQTDTVAGFYKVKSPF
jgi:Domain of unknown function (DUF4157)